MKKLLALLLCLSTLLPMGLIPVVNAEEEVAAQPFYVLGWSDFDQEKYPYLDGLVSSSFKNIGDKAILTYGNGQMMYGGYTDADVTKVAEAIKKEMDSRPEGLRYWHMFGPLKILKLAPKHVVYLDFGVNQLKDLTTAVLKKYKEIGGQLDGVVLDTEYFGMRSWYIYSNSYDKNPNNYQTNKNIYADIVNDPRYATQIRPLLEDLGFPFWPNPSGYQSEIFTICHENKGAEYDYARSIWDTAMRIHLNRYANEWCYEPLKEYFPEASLSDYQSQDSKSWMKLYGITDDGSVLSGGNSIRVGTASSASYYYARPGADFYNKREQYAAFNDAHYEASPFNTLLYDINYTRHMYESTDTKQIAPWITSYVYNGKKAHSMAYTPYYSELIYHLGMFDPEPFLSFTWVNDYAEDDGTISYTSTKYLLTQQILNELMADLTRVAGYSDRKPIAMPMYWNAEFILSGMYANGRNIWRITPNTDEISLEAFKVEGQDPTFSVKGRTVTFPGGKILESPEISTAGSCGYWVETAKEVTPVVTNLADRYAKYPSWLEDFEKYNEGNWAAVNAKPANTWEVKCSIIVPSASNIVANATGKALAVNGDVALRNVILPEKITAGDTYAKDQAWEITVTVPEGLSDKAEIILLNYEGERTSAEDGGFKIIGGKLYYSVLNQTKTKYEALMDITPGTYTFRRAMNFHDSKNFTSTYTVLDAQGKELKSVQSVVVPAFTRILAIGIAVKGADKAVLLDDYKLYPNGVTAGFELYDAASGRNVKTSSRAESTAYRLSWLNGTNAEAKATVMAAIYENGTLKEKKVVKEVQMLPGYDNVETGIVEVAEGQHIMVYLQTSYGAEAEIPTADPYVPETKPTQPAPTEPTTAPTDPTTAPTNPTTAPTESTQSPEVPAKKESGPNVLAVIAVAAIVLAVAAVIVVLKVPVKKNKPSDDPSSTEK